MKDNLLDTQQFESCTRLYVGFSGGLDSTVLLHALKSIPELLPKLAVLHVNHGLSPNALAWEDHCEKVCKDWSLNSIVHHANLALGGNMEARAREARYRFFIDVLEENDILVLAHHQDDQAETLLLNLCRGAGVDGLAAMPALSGLGGGTLARPLLHVSRSQLLDYARHHKLYWIDDESNQDVSFSRNYIRHTIIPALQTRWPAFVSNAARCAEHLQNAQCNLDRLANIDLQHSTPMLSLRSLQRFDKIQALNVLRSWIKKHAGFCPSAKTLERVWTEVIHARADANPVVTWGENAIRRYRNDLYFFKREYLHKQGTYIWNDFPEPLYLGTGLGYLTVDKVSAGLHVPSHKQLTIRFRQGGEVFHWRGQTKSLKKLLQQWKVPTWERARLPLIYIDDTLAAIPGFAVCDEHYSSLTPSGYCIRWQMAELLE